ncbi:hypothetical protein NMY22_g13713 [Coprinellus aureogranulatus]|nr:hypothetical protein NMY22_g13713 [Coprinellus aureogranulatus]
MASGGLLSPPSGAARSFTTRLTLSTTSSEVDFTTSAHPISACATPWSFCWGSYCARSDRPGETTQREETYCGKFGQAGAHRENHVTVGAGRDWGKENRVWPKSNGDTIETKVAIEGELEQLVEGVERICAMNFETGETVAVKEIQLSNIPKGELPEIMSEIDLLKNLHHANIVQYKGFVKTRDFLYIILELCENGSLHSILKKFGKFPENLVAVFISQVLEGLLYLHDQGVIHRDIKGANILTDKNGTVKLADFGVAAKTGGVMDAAVVGSPYWMAPEVIEQSGATTASDIWSVGCVVIELLEGHPPYHNLDPMPALFRIVQDDCPPIPEGASPVVKDFLYHCFQKDCNLRISARKLLRHPWMVSARKQLGDGKAESSRNDSQTPKRPLSNYNYDEAVLKVQEWNEALKSPSRNKNPARDPRPSSPLQRHSELPGPSTSSSAISATPGTMGLGLGWKSNLASSLKPAVLAEKIQPNAFKLQSPEEQDDNWDDDFEGGISLTKLHALEKSTGGDDKSESSEDNTQTIRPTKSPAGKVCRWHEHRPRSPSWKITQTLLRKKMKTGSKKRWRTSRY